MKHDAGTNAVGIVIAENDYPLVIFIASTILKRLFHVQYQQRVIHIIAVFRIKKFSASACVFTLGDKEYF